MPQYCTVFHRIDSIKIDGEDADRNPDRVPVTGTIVFTPILAQGDSVVVTEDGVKSTLNIEPVVAQIQLGQLMHRGELGVKLFAGGEDSNPERIRWRATFHNLISGTTKITLKDVVFEAIPGGELALSLTQPVPSKPYPGFSQNLEEALQAITEAGENTAIELEAIVAEAESVARTTAQQELSEALPTKADKVHTHTTAQVTGLDTALTNADWYKGTIPAGATLNDLPRGMYQIQGGNSAVQLGLPSRVGSLEIGQSYNGTKTALAIVNLAAGTLHEVWTNSQHGTLGTWMGWRKSVLTDPASSTTLLDLRADNSLGTRIFAGDTMIFGDTRWRIVPSTDPSVNVFMRRVNEKVYARVSTTAFAGSGTVKVLDIPMGLRPENINRLLYSETSGNAPSKLLVVFPDQAWLELRSKTQDAPLYFDADWITVDPWPTA